MPIIDVEVVGREDGLPDPTRLAHELAAVTASAPGGTWVRVRRLSANDYAEDSVSHTLPVFVTILRATLPAPTELKREAAEVARVVGAACNRPVENTHVLYLPAGAGRIAFGGVLREA